MNTLKLPATLMHPQANVCHAQWVQSMRSAPVAQTWMIDASELTQFDSSALAVLLSCRREALALGHVLRVEHMPPKLQQLAGLYGVSVLLGA